MYYADPLHMSCGHTEREIQAGRERGRERQGEGETGREGERCSFPVPVLPTSVCSELHKLINLYLSQPLSISSEIITEGES